MVKCFAISDTHGFHNQVIVPEAIDLLLYAGDSTNSYGLTQNLIEFEDFFHWLVHLNIPNKVLIAGNHDTWATKAFNRDRLKEAGIIYLENEYTQIEGIKIFGSPWTPTYGNWSFMKDRSKLDDIWKNVESDTDIWLTHGPPHGILDLSENRDYQLNQCGDVSLYKRVMEKRPLYHIFGHIHSFKTCRNQGAFQPINHRTTFINVSAVEDGGFDKGLISNGIVFEI